MPLHYWNGRDYIRKRVLPVMDELAKMQALDPNDFTGRNSLRNLAEMEVRYHNHELTIHSFRSNNSKLVVSSVHADCSKRCYKWQGRVYSLDGTYGITDDGRKYVPLEEATDIFYTTKAGRVYKNGLLGFNCRHRLLPYISGVQPEHISNDEQKKQYAINNTQRAMERRIRYEKLRSDLYKNLDYNEYQKVKSDVIVREREYKEFCLKNQRAFYAERLQVLKPNTKEDRDKYYVIEKNKNQDKINYKLDNFFQNRVDKQKTIVYTDSVGMKKIKYTNHAGTKKSFTQNGIQDIVNKQEKLDRTYYDKNGVMIKQIHSSHTHNVDGIQLKMHAHEYDFTKKEYRSSRELTDEERRVINEFERTKKL